MPNRIAWRRLANGNTYGFINTVHLFTIKSGYVSEHSVEGVPWSLECWIPIRLEKVEFESDTQAKKYAELIMGSFVRHIGAEWRRVA